ncbi:hypothetical protein M407DRAFT_26395, partial [Tulasnella calospora MUT 4182]
MSSFAGPTDVWTPIQFKVFNAPVSSPAAVAAQAVSYTFTKSPTLLNVLTMFLKPSFAAILASLASVQVANAWFRLACATPLVQERVDPIIAP